MALILNIETATEICSVALSKDKEILVLKEIHEGYQHASKVTLLIKACLEKASLSLEQINAVAVSEGPGSYTGLRIGASVAKGLCYALDIPLISISTLDALAYYSKQKYPNAQFHIPMIDARRMEVYTSIYDASLKRIKEVHALVLDEKSFDSFQKRDTLIFSGNGSKKMLSLINQQENHIFIANNCSASNIAILAAEKFEKRIFEDIAYFKPFYLKSPNITRPKKIL